MALIKNFTWTCTGANGVNGTQVYLYKDSVNAPPNGFSYVGVNVGFKLFEITNLDVFINAVPETTVRYPNLKSNMSLGNGNLPDLTNSTSTRFGWVHFYRIEDTYIALGVFVHHPSDLEAVTYLCSAYRVGGVGNTWKMGKPGFLKGSRQSLIDIFKDRQFILCYAYNYLNFSTYNSYHPIMVTYDDPLTWFDYLDRYEINNSDIYDLQSVDNSDLPKGDVFLPSPDSDPYSGNQTPTGPNTGTSTGGGDGSHENINDNIDIPSIPTRGAVNAGFVSLFVPSVGEIRSLASYMWSDLFSFDTFRKLFADPMECILGLSLIPYNVPTSGHELVYVGNMSTGISMARANSQFFYVDCGTLTIKKYWGSYLDFAPYTKLDLYLPFIGTHALNPDDVMDLPINIQYMVDIVSGACTAFVKVNNHVLYTFVGSCASQIPITGNNWSNTITSTTQIAASLGTLVATGGLSAPLSAATAVEAGAAVGAGAGVAGNVMAMKPHYEKSGAVGGAGGYMGIRKPYIILTRPEIAVPQHSNKMIGYPSLLYGAVGNYSGYTVFQNVHVDSCPATDEEKKEIEMALLKGVIL